MRLPEPLKPAIRTFVGVALFAGVGLWALEPLRDAGGAALRDYAGRATLVAALTVAFAAPAPLGNAAVVCAQRVGGGLLGAAAAAGALAVPPRAVGARVAAAATLPLAAVAVFIGQDAHVQYGAQFAVLTYILVAVEGSAAGGGLDAVGALAAARGAGVLAGALAAGALGVAVCPQAASNAAARRLGGALAQTGVLARAALAPLAGEEGGGEGEGGGRDGARPPPWWRAAARAAFLRSSSPLVVASPPPQQQQPSAARSERAGSAALTTISDLVEGAGAAAAAAAAVGAPVRGGGEGEGEGGGGGGGGEDGGRPPPPRPAPGPDTATARAAAALAADLAAVEAALPWTAAEVCAGGGWRGGGPGRPPWARVWLPGRSGGGGPGPAAARRRVPAAAVADAVAAVRAAASTLVLASTVRGAALSPGARAAVSAFWAEAGRRAGMEGGASAADPLAAVAAPAAEAWAGLAAGWGGGRAGGVLGGPSAAALAAAAAAARAAVRSLLATFRSQPRDPSIPAFLAGLTAEEAGDARALIRSRLALGALVASDFERAAGAVAAVEAGWQRGWWVCGSGGG